MSSLVDLLARGDLDGLVREVDRRALLGNWDGVLELRDAAMRAAEETGRQLWGAAQYAEYRTALDAPAAIAASVVQPGAARFALGPLTEVVAQQHTWAELADHLMSAAVLSQVAQERILRGEDLRDDPRAHLAESGLPGVLLPWEPRYPLPTYRDTEVLADGPAPLPPGELLPADTAPGTPAGLPEVASALADIVAPWAQSSTGEVHVAVVDGGAGGAVAALLGGEVWLRRISIGEAFARLAWAGGSGGVHGRRRGMAAGRAAAFWFAHAVTDLLFPADPDDLEFELEERRWFTFTDGDETGWRLRVAVEDDDGWAAAIDAFDREPDEEEADDAAE